MLTSTTPHPHPVVVIAINGPIGCGKSSLVDAMNRILCDRGTPNLRLGMADAVKDQLHRIGIKSYNRELLCSYSMALHRFDDQYWDNLWFERVRSYLTQLLFNSDGSPVKRFRNIPAMVLVDNLRLASSLDYLLDLCGESRKWQKLAFHTLFLSPFHVYPDGRTTDYFPYLDEVRDPARPTDVEEFELQSQFVGKLIANRASVLGIRLPGQTAAYSTYRMPVLGPAIRKHFTQEEIQEKLTRSRQFRAKNKPLSPAAVRRNYRQALDILGFAHRAFGLPPLGPTVA